MSGWPSLQCCVDDRGVVFDLVFEVLQTFVVEDMQFGEDHGFCQSIDERLVCAHHLTQCAVFHWLNENGIAKCLFLIAFSQVGFVGNPAAAW